MVSVCNILTKGFYIFDYDTINTNFGYTYEVAPGHAAIKKARSVSAIHGSINIIGDHEDSLFNLYVGPFSQNTGIFPKFFISSSNLMTDLNYIQSTSLVMAISRFSPSNIELHDTS
jgi:hypothetical protein